ncbi:hypothetical protein JRV97_11515 [Marinitoga aeolica]|uniref:Transcriptional regulator n=2 Tax=Marinitoga aeolica TaxID=2809031 RepID=A0ABY8PQR0_9BACT|nr:hypothetical protein JRV97_11515 [Marinitoga aeolica]
MELCRLNGLKEPDFYDDGRYFKIVIYKTIENKKIFNNAISNNNAGIVPEGAGKMPEKLEMDKKIYDYLIGNEKITRKEVEILLNIKERRARDILKMYVDKGYLKKIGKGKNTYYILNANM